MNNKGIVLFSGGLDSLLAVRVLQEQNTELVGVHFLLPYESDIISAKRDSITRYADMISLPIRFIECNDNYVQMLKNPVHGYGKNCNPCIDCKILFQRLARTIMDEEGASYIATGEVNGQRPMSQKRDIIRHIEKEAGTDGYILRPLSIRFFKPTHVESANIIDRSRLLSIHGRGRHVQLKLAKQYGITRFATPAGGCLFTDPHYASRVFHLIENYPSFTHVDLQLMRIGRHFSLDENCRILVTRNLDESKQAVHYRKNADLYAEPSFKGPTALGFGRFNDRTLQLTADIIARYGKSADNKTEQTVTVTHDGCEKEFIPRHVDEETISSFRI